MTSNTENRRVCFIANYTKTYFFHEVAKLLETQGVSIYWIVVNPRLREFLLEHYEAGRVLYIGKERAEGRLARVGEYKINELVDGDRTLRLKPDAGRRYLLGIQRPIFEFLRLNAIQCVFGELTWAHEILTRRIIAGHPELGCRYLNPHTVRIPNGRFAFFTDEFQSEFLEMKGHESVAEGPHRLILQKPDYLALNDRLVRNSRSVTARLQKIKRFITAENIDDDDPTLVNRRWRRLKLRCREELNKELYRFVRRISLSDVDGRKFVFWALHKQPEASIDVIGRYYEDQYRDIVNLWRILPDDWHLLVKEHTNAIGDRAPAFYRRLQKLPNTHIVKETEDSHEIIKRCELVVTVSGTVAYEAALLGKPAFTLAPTFFNRFEGCRRLGLDDIRNARDIYELLLGCGKSAGSVQDYVMSHSREGIISDPSSNPQCMEPSNLSRVAEAMLAATNSAEAAI